MCWVNGWDICWQLARGRVELLLESQSPIKGEGCHYVSTPGSLPVGKFYSSLTVDGYYWLAFSFHAMLSVLFSHTSLCMGLYFYDWLVNFKSCMLIPDVIDPAIKIGTTTFSFLFFPTWRLGGVNSISSALLEGGALWLSSPRVCCSLCSGFVNYMSSVAFSSANAIVLPLHFRNSSITMHSWILFVCWDRVSV